jgi:hypothetical protein
MTEQEFNTRLTHIEDQAAALQERVDGYRDQQMARLFVESAWSQQELAERLAKRWGKEVSQRWVSYHLVFGRFLTFFSTSCAKDEWKIPSNLTEGAFRRFFEATTASDTFTGQRAYTEAARKDEQRRFGEVLEQMKDGHLARPRNKVKQAITDFCAGKPWMTAGQRIATLKVARGKGWPDVARPGEQEMVA